MLFRNDVDWQEALKFRPGRRVELKRQPGVFDIIASYDPMMVPPISLVNDPLPRYPEELRLIHRPDIGISRLNRQYQSKAQHPACGLHDSQKPIRDQRISTTDSANL